MSRGLRPHTTSLIMAASEREEAPTCKKHSLKSGKVRSVDSLVTKKVVLPHEVVYTSQRQPAVYSELSVALFINGYLIVLAEESEDTKAHMLQHLQELLEDSERYGWRSVRITMQLGCNILNRAELCGENMAGKPSSGEL